MSSKYFKYLLLVSISGFLCALDQLTKMYVHVSLRVGDVIEVIPDFFNITYVRNPGAAFGFLSESNPVFRDIFFFLIPPIALLVVISVLRSVENSDRIQITSLSLIFGGAIGNYIDRVRGKLSGEGTQYVIDFLDFYYKGYSWPAFNVADIGIVSGIILLIIVMIRDSKKAIMEKKLAQSKL